MDFFLKNNIAFIINDKLNVPLGDERYHEMVMPLISLPTCGEGMVGYAPVLKKKKGGRKSKKQKRKRLGIGCLCEEALDMLEEFDPEIKSKIPVCKDDKPIGFVEVKPMGFSMTPYQQFMKKCVSSKEGPVKNKFSECAKMWKEIKDDKYKLEEWGIEIPKRF